MKIPAALAKQLLETNFENICAKLKSGGTLTAGEKAELAALADTNDQGPAPAPNAPAARPTLTPPTDRHALAAFYSVTTRTIDNWRKMKPPAPVHDIADMIEWSTNVPKLSRACRQRLEELRSTITATPGQENAFEDPDWTEFSKRATPDGNDTRTSMAALARARDFAALKLEKASRVRDRPSVKFYSDLLASHESTLHDALLRAQRLGRDLGESFSAEAVDQLGISIGFWLLRGADALIGELASALANATASGPLDRETIRKTIDPLILESRVLTPLVRATQVDAGVRLPARFVAAIKTGIGWTLENGEAEFDRLYATPPPRPAGQLAVQS